MDVSIAGGLKQWRTASTRRARTSTCRLELEFARSGISRRRVAISRRRIPISARRERIAPGSAHISSSIAHACDGDVSIGPPDAAISAQQQVVYGRVAELQIRRATIAPNISPISDRRSPIPARTAVVRLAEVLGSRRRCSISSRPRASSRHAFAFSRRGRASSPRDSGRSDRLACVSARLTAFR